MAQDLRSRAGLRPRRRGAQGPTGPLVALVVLGACGRTPAPAAPTPRAVDTSALAAEAVVAAVLAECHAPLRGQMDRVAATVTFVDGSSAQLFAELPQALRVQDARGNFLLRADSGLRLDGAAAAVTTAELERLRRLRHLLDVAAFGPLHRATSCERLDATTFRCRDDAGTTTRFALRPGTLLPASFSCDDATVTVVDYLRTPTTWIAQELDMPGLGRCRVRFESRHVAWDPELFRVPAAHGSATAPNPGTPGVRLPAGAAGEPRSTTPTLSTAAALRWALVRDPGEWPARVAAYAPLHEELVRQQQAIAGFPVLFRDDDGEWLAAPFRGRADGPAFAPPAGWRLREVPAGRWLYVYPASGDLAARRLTGEQALREALAAMGLRARGPLTTQPFLHLQEGEPPAEKLAAPVVRVAVAVD